MKKKLYLFICLSLILLSGCSTYNSALYKTGGKSKGIVLMLPVTENFHMREKNKIYTWDLKEEFNREISKRFSLSNKIYLLKQSVSSKVAEQFFSPEGFFISNQVINQLLPAEFVVATELLDQNELIDDLGNGIITASLRVRVYDLRKEEVKLIYQEIMEASQPIVASNVNDYVRYSWRSKVFDSTPMGLMHNRLMRELVGRVEGYICANY